MLRRSFPPITQGLALLPWDDAYDIGIPEIDQDHHQLAALFNSFAALVLVRGDAAHSLATDPGLLADGAPLLAGFHELLQAHCVREEVLIASQEAVREQLNLHRHDHTDFLATVKMLRESLGGGQVSAYEIAYLLYDWIKRHVLEGDADLFKGIVGAREGSA